jgi:hypothetical protein
VDLDDDDAEDSWAFVSRDEMVDDDDAVDGAIKEMLPQMKSQQPGGRLLGTRVLGGAAGSGLGIKQG